MRIAILFILMLCGCAHAQQTPNPAPSSSPSPDPSITFSSQVDAFKVESDGTLLLRGKEIGKEPAVYQSLINFMAQSKKQIDSCMSELAKANSQVKPAKK